MDSNKQTIEVLIEELRHHIIEKQLYDHACEVWECNSRVISLEPEWQKEKSPEFLEALRRMRELRAKYEDIHHQIDEIYNQELALLQDFKKIKESRPVVYCTFGPPNE